MKKLLAMMLALCMVLAIFAGCAASPSDDDDTKKPNGNSSSQNKDDDKDDDKDNDKDSDKDDDKDSDKDDNDSKKVTVEETVIYDENDIKVTVKSLDEGWSGPELKVLVENNTDKDIAFSADEFIINGITLSGFGYVEAAAGKKANDTISFYEEQLELCGIETIATIVGVDAHIFDSESYDDLYETPFSITTSAGADYEQIIDDSGDVLFESDGVTVIYKGMGEDMLGKTVNLLVKNETGKDITVEAEDVSVNDFTITSWMYDKIYSDTVRYCTVDIGTSQLEENEIEEIEKVCFSISVTDPETYDTIAESDEIEISVTE